MPKCKSPLVTDHNVIGEICHIRARNKKGPRYDPLLTPSQKDEIDNLLLLCPTCHTLADKNHKTYSVELLAEIKEIHERGAEVEITPKVMEQAMRLLNGKDDKRDSGNFSNATASNNSVSVSVGGDNKAPININLRNSSGSKKRGFAKGSIGEDANMSNYVEYLCELYVKFMSPIENDEKALYGRIGKQIKTRFRLAKRTRNDLSAERFYDLVDFLIHEKLALTPVGRKHLRNGTPLCRTFDEYRHGQM